MKFEPTKLSKVIERNFSYLMPDFYEMQTEYMQSMNDIYKDLDTALIAMFLTNKLYQSENKKIIYQIMFLIKTFIRKINLTHL
tara:strand:+ start:32 stop:280 length:249 start_codon:yes stop_codon:yes gene_type:complete